MLDLHEKEEGKIAKPTYICRAPNQNAIIVRPLRTVRLRTILSHICPIEDLIVIRNQRTRLFQPFKYLFRLVRIRRVPRVQSQSGAQLEESAVGRYVLVIPAL